MVKKKNRLVLKQSIKYFFIVIIGLFAFFLWGFLWDLPQNIKIWGLAITGLIILVSAIFDILTIDDIIPIFGR